MEKSLREMSVEELQILERKEIYQFNTENLIPYLYKLDRKLAQRIANFRGLNRRGRLREVWQKAYSAYQKEHPNEFNRYYETLMEINRAIQRKMEQQ
jgi:hypothetical protein